MNPQHVDQINRWVKPTSCAAGICGLSDEHDVDCPEVGAAYALTRKISESSITKELTAVTEPVEPPAEDLSRGAIKRWFYEGAILPATDDGSVSTADLLEFAQLAHKHYPTDKVWLHAYGLRVTRTAGESGPRLEWRDWD